MKRDNDLMRELLFRLEKEDDHLSAAFASHMGMSKQERKEEGHLKLLVDAGLVAQTGRTDDIYRITNRGHDFIEAIRSDSVWNKTKAIAQDAGAATIGVLFDVAIGLAKQKLTEKTGIQL